MQLTFKNYNNKLLLVHYNYYTVIYHSGNSKFLCSIIVVYYNNTDAGNPNQHYNSIHGCTGHT